MKRASLDNDISAFCFFIIVTLTTTTIYLSINLFAPQITTFYIHGIIACMKEFDKQN